ncbi:ClpXP protease specificity-enhancing factor [Methylococcus sp. EFPC2]|uniref:ClpXP protease specificity-enhancing factor n=1 Tax=Methylococcus sp. EFPC2 TaxID=2812648 RepID=UPI0019671183|nr:ClpXP protease specificity-enhancing factor [Methylococcus sp. EFPC2]QSA98705.1 ClpXP protease specificity-enhancing factor [Methylococcus sp. EFPC2]
MGSLKPYLIRAVYDWIVDNNCTPYLLVNAEAKDVEVPTAYVEDGRIVLNLRPQAVQGLQLGDKVIEFSARFSGTPMHVRAPIAAVLAIYARENGRGMVFEEGEDDAPPPPEEPEKGGEQRPPRARPNLRVVK